MRGNKHGERSSATPNERPQVRAETRNFRKMNCYPILALGVTVVGCLLTSQTTSRAAEENNDVFYHSPGGGYDIEFIKVNDANEPFVVSTKDRAKRALL